MSRTPLERDHLLRPNRTLPGASANCPGCQLAVPPMARFCADCGTRLSTQDAAVASGAMQGTKSRRELRPLTILFADLVSSSALATRLDPEDYTEIIGAFFRA